jgi:acetate kinase
VIPPRQTDVLTMNRGSSTLKAALYDAGKSYELLLSIAVDQGTGSSGRLKIHDSKGSSLLESSVAPGDSNSTLDTIFAWLGEHNYLSNLAAVGHRLVHGGARYRDPHRVDSEFLAAMERLLPLDPDHMPAAIGGIQFVANKFPQLPQVACFDTAFHRSLPAVARMYALPRAFFDQDIFRYGFHGLSYEYIMGELAKLDGERASGRVIIAHLGSGASMVAVKDGKSTDTSMGFTPLEGLVMSTRSGDIDPGVLLYLLEYKKMPAKEISTLVNKQSGLLGVSTTSGDMKALLESSHDNARAAEAVDLFCYRAKKYIGAYAAVLGGLDVLVFAGGIGEHAPEVRRRICSGLEFLGVSLDDRSNAANAAVISRPESRVKVRVIETDEDLMIVRHVCATLGWARIE